jgi:alpha-N-arabinofuranosidase
MLHASASRNAAGQLHLSLVNLDPHRALNLAGARGFSGGKGRLLTADALNAHNTFERPNVVEPREIERFSVTGPSAFVLPPKSLAVLEVE